MFMAMAAMGTKRQVTFGAAGTGATENTTSSPFPVPYPASIVAGNFLLLHVVIRDTGGHSVSTPSGWTLLDSEVSTIGSYLFWKRAAGDETGNLDVVYTAINADLNMLGRMYRFSHGAGVEAVASALDSSADTTATAIDVTTLGAKRMAVQAIWVSSSTTVAAITGESNADYTEAVAEYSSGTTAGSLSLQIAEVASPVAITGGTATVGSSSSDIVHGFAIRP